MFSSKLIGIYIVPRAISFVRKSTPMNFHQANEFPVAWRAGQVIIVALKNASKIHSAQLAQRARSVRTRSPVRLGSRRRFVLYNSIFFFAFILREILLLTYSFRVDKLLFDFVKWEESQLRVSYLFIVQYLNCVERPTHCFRLYYNSSKKEFCLTLIIWKINFPL